MASNKNDFVSNKRLYLDKDGNVVDAKDPNKTTLLVNEGGSIPAELAEKHGLNKVPETAAPAENDEATEDAPEAPAKKAPAKKAPAKKK